jgi:hypothetical protein
MTAGGGGGEHDRMLATTERLHKVIVLENIVVGLHVVCLADNLCSCQLWFPSSLSSAQHDARNPTIDKPTFFFPLALSLSSCCLVLPKTLNALDTFLV